MVGSSALDSSQLHCPKTQIGNKILCEKNIKQGVCHTVALPFTFFKKDLKAKEELWKLKYFTMQEYNLQKIL
jgi:hypothetical protein